MRQGKNVVTNFPLPDAAPSAVAGAYDRFDEAATKWALIKGEIEEAEAAVEAAKQKDSEAVAAAFKRDGAAPADPAKHERDALAKLAGLRLILEAAATATDEAGNNMLGPIVEAKAEWIASLEPAVAEATTP